MIRYITFLVSIFIGNLCFAQDKINDIDSVIKTTHTLHPEIGMSVGLFYDMELHFFSYGNINRTSGQTIDNETIFEIGSITKLFTSYLIAQQVKAGKISLDSYVEEYLPPHIVLNSKKDKSK